MGLRQPGLHEGTWYQGQSGEDTPANKKKKCLMMYYTRHSENNPLYTVRLILLLIKTPLLLLAFNFGTTSI